MNSSIITRMRTWASPQTIILVLIIGACASTLARDTRALRMQENSVDAIWPTAETAYTIAERHFNALDPAEYDIERAREFYNRALTRDPHIPYVRHQLARIAFLQADFAKALVFINDELSTNPDPSPASYYIRALIKGYVKDYDGAAFDYETYFKITPANWAGINDYAWVLIKGGRTKMALAALDWGLQRWPDNPWLINNRTTALFELGRYSDAKQSADVAMNAVRNVSREAWLVAYPGNDPAIADQGVTAFQKAVADNQKLVTAALNKKSSTK